MNRKIANLSGSRDFFPAVLFFRAFAYALPDSLTNFGLNMIGPTEDRCTCTKKTNK